MYAQIIAELMRELEHFNVVVMLTKHWVPGPAGRAAVPVGVAAVPVGEQLYLYVGKLYL